MKQAYRRWVCGLLACILALLAVCGAVVYVVDPCLYYRVPDKWQPVLFNERYQMAGLAKNVEADTVLVGTSMAANYRSSWIQETFGTSAVRLTIPDGYYSEFDQVMNVLFRTQEPERVIFGLDPNLLARSPEEEPEELPEYLYDKNPWNDGQYLLNKDAAFRSVYTVLKKGRGQTQPLQDAFVWDGNVFFSRELALAGYERPEPTGETAAADTFLENSRANLKEVTGWLEAHPDTDFIFFFSPYSILFWDKMERLGQTEAMFTMLEDTVQTLLAYDNAELQFFMADREIMTNLDNYADHIHIAGRVTYRLAQAMPTGQYRLSRETYREVLDGLREFVINYDYDSIWEPG